jgi:DNA-binding NarL/FixJ family response regulator
MLVREIMEASEPVTLVAVAPLTNVAIALRREPRFARIALVCYSIERDPQILRAVRKAGCDAVVAKDDGVERLLESLRTSVEQAAGACPAPPDPGTA